MKCRSPNASDSSNVFNWNYNGKVETDNANNNATLRQLFII